MTEYNYCFVCNGAMENAWICNPCIQELDHEKVARFFHVVGGHMPRTSPDDPIPQECKALGLYIDPDYRVDVGL